jgi:hypothetical protein
MNQSKNNDTLTTLAPLIDRYVVGNGINLDEIVLAAGQDHGAFSMAAHQVRNMIQQLKTGNGSSIGTLGLWAELLDFNIDITLTPNKPEGVAVKVNYNPAEGTVYYNADTVAPAAEHPADGEIVSYEPVYSLEEQLAKYPDYETKIRAAAELIGKKVELIRHADPQGDHIPLGTTGEILGFASEPFDGLVMALGGGETDLVYAEEVRELFDMRFTYAMLTGISDIIDRQDSMITQIDSVVGNAADSERRDFQIASEAAIFCRTVNAAAQVATSNISAINNTARSNIITSEGISVGIDPDTDPRS